MTKPDFPDFEACLEMLRKGGREGENGYQDLLPHVKELLPQLIKALHKPENESAKGWILELIGLTRTYHSIETLKDSLLHDSDMASSWATSGLLRQLSRFELLDLIETVELYKLEYPDASPQKIYVWDLFIQEAKSKLDSLSKPESQKKRKP